MAVLDSFTVVSKRELLLAISGVALLVACIGLLAGVITLPKQAGGGATQGPVKPTLEPATQYCTSHTCYEVGAFVLTNQNTTVDPCDNFYQYACGNWPNVNDIPPNYAYWDIRTVFSRANTEKMEDVLLDPIERPHSYSYERKVKQFYQTCVDSYGRSKDSASHLLELINTRMGGWYVLKPSIKNSWDVKAAFSAIFGPLDVEPFIRPYIYSYTSSTYRAMLRFYYQTPPMSWRYFLTNPTYVSAFRDYVSKVAGFLVEDAGYSQNQTIMNRTTEFVDDVVNMELNLSRILNDNYRTSVRLTTLRSLQTANSIIPWKDVFTTVYQAARVTENTQVYVYQMDYFNEMDSFVNSLGNDSYRFLNNYVVWKFAYEYAKELSNKYFVAFNRFREAIRYGTYRQSIETVCYNLVKARMADAFNAEFVKDHVVDNIKAEVQGMFAAGRTSSKQLVSKYSWMDNATKAVASEKLTRLVDKVGYPDYLADDQLLDEIYSELDISTANGFFKNLMNTNDFVFKQQIKRLINGYTRDIWRISPTATYAYYYGPWNEIQLPAALLQFPYFWKKGTKAHKFGGLGLSLSQNLVRSFDESGFRYLPNGTYKTGTSGWYSADSYTKLQNKKNCFIGYYGTLKAGPFYDTSQGQWVYVPCNGQRYGSIGMSLAAGIRHAFYAYKTYTAEEDDRPLPGVEATNDQLFFIASVQSQCFYMRPDYAYNRAKAGWALNDVTINGALSQVKEFGDAFKCPKGSNMNPETQCDAF